MSHTGVLEAALAKANRDVLRRRAERAERDRRSILEQFPLSGWPTLRLEQYAQGTGLAAETTFCTLVEFGTDELGSIKGGSAAKHMIYQWVATRSARSAPANISASTSNLPQSGPPIA